MTLSALAVSSPDVGSSRKRMRGLVTSSTAMVTRLRASVDRPLRDETRSQQNKARSIMRILRVVLGLGLLNLTLRHSRHSYKNSSGARATVREVWLGRVMLFTA